MKYDFKTDEQGYVIYQGNLSDHLTDVIDAVAQHNLGLGDENCLKLLYCNCSECRDFWRDNSI